MKSVIQEVKHCFVCKSPYVESHHIFFGSLRKVAEKYGLTVWLCPEHHRGNHSPHMCRKLDLELKVLAQNKFLETHTKEEWLNEFGKLYYK